MLGIPSGFRCVRVLAVPPSVPVATVPFSNVNVVCEVVFSDSDCELNRRPFRSPENARRVLWKAENK